MKGFCYLWNKYCSKFITVAHFNPTPNLPINFNLILLGEQLPASQWSDGLLKMLDLIGHKHFILMLEDYWLYDYVDIQTVNALGRLINDDILRIDLSGNRAAYNHIVLNNGLVETLPGTPYQMSYQAAIWHKDNLRKVLEKGENPWQSEINGSERVGNLRVLGTKQAVMKYQPVWRSKQKRWQLDKLNSQDLEYIRTKGWLNHHSSSRIRM